MRYFPPATLVVLLLAAPPQGRAGVQAEPVQDDTVVLRAVIEHTIIPTHRRTHPDTAEPLPVVGSSTPLCRQRSLGQSACHIPDQWWRFIEPDASRNWPGLVDDERTRRDLVASLEARNAESHPLPLSSVTSVVLVESRAALPEAEFRSPVSATLSLPGYSSDGYAIVYGTYFCGALCGYGWLFVLEKDKGQWRVRSATVTVIS